VVYVVLLLSKSCAAGFTYNFHKNFHDALNLLLRRKWVRCCERQLKVTGPQLGPVPHENLKISWRASTDCSAPAKPQKRHAGLLSCRGCLRNETRTIIITSRERVAPRCRFYCRRGSRRWRDIVRTCQVSAGGDRRTIFRAKIIAFRIRPNGSLGEKNI